MKNIMSLLVLFFSLNAYSATNPGLFQGHWKGTGIYKLNGVQLYCHSFEMHFDGNETSMIFAGGNRECQNHSEKFDRVVMNYSSGRLYFGSQVVGTFDGKVLESFFSMPEANGDIRHWRMSMRREGNTLIYEESRRVNDNETPLISFVGVLDKQEHSQK